MSEQMLCECADPAKYEWLPEHWDMDHHPLCSKQSYSDRVLQRASNPTSSTQGFSMKVIPLCWEILPSGERVFTEMEIISINPVLSENK